ncbi:hypothetical protein, partial [Pseudomonas migulae]|uniref:hypothetical protein n=1 Tax=Pseudomonas migulae TaxID=78543 RepID=UPI001C3F52F2
RRRRLACDGGLTPTPFSAEAPNPVEAVSRRGSSVGGGLATVIKKSTYIQFSSFPHRHYQTRSRRIDAGGFLFVQVSHERFAVE